jgi:hypothetical protein
LVLDHDDGVLEVLLRGPWGAIALVEMRDAIRARASLDEEASAGEPPNGAGDG